MHRYHILLFCCSLLLTLLTLPCNAKEKVERGAGDSTSELMSDSMEDCSFESDLFTSQEIITISKNYQYPGSHCDWLSGLTDALKFPLISITDFKYKGGFRVSAKPYGHDEFESAGFSMGIFHYSPKRNSIYLIGNPRFGTVAEFEIPKLSESKDISDFAVAKVVDGNYINFYKQGDPSSIAVTGIKSYFRPAGLTQVDNALIVNYINWYDAEGTEIDTSIVIDNADQLPLSTIKGPYQLDGRAYAAGSLSTIPSEWQRILGGSLISGSPVTASISSRLSIGASAFSFYPRGAMLIKSSGRVRTNNLMSFPLSNILYDKTRYPEGTHRTIIMDNKDKRNDLWTRLSGTAYGFIVPGTRSYITVGKSAGHHSGIGYKIIQNDGTRCGGPCPFDAKDYYSYYWVWDIADLIRVKHGLMQPHDMRPYAYGEWEIPLNVGKYGVSGGSFDLVSKRLILSISDGDRLNKYARLPLFIVFDYRPEINDN